MSGQAVGPAEVGAQARVSSPLWGAVWAVAEKDLRVELRTRYALGSVLPFAATMLLAFGFALGPDRTLLQQTAPGLLWLAGLFAAVDLFHRSYQSEAEGGALDGLLLAPVHKGAVYLGKALAAAAQVLVLLVVTGLMVAVLFGLRLGRDETDPFHFHRVDSALSGAASPLTSGLGRDFRARCAHAAQEPPLP